MAGNCLLVIINCRSLLLGYYTVPLTISYQFIITFSLKLCKKEEEIARIYIFACSCICFNTSCRRNSVNCELVRKILILLWFYVLVLLSKSNFCQSELWPVEQKTSLLVYLKFLPLKFLIACFYRTFSRPWCLLKKIVPMNLENYWVDNFWLKLLYSGSFCFCTSVFIILLQWISK